MEKKNKRARNKLAQIWRRRGWTDRRLARPVCSSGWLCELWETLLLTVLPTHMHVHWREHFMCMALTPSDHSNSCCPKAKWQARKGGEGGLRLVFIWVCEEWVFEWISVRRVGGSVCKWAWERGKRRNGSRGVSGSNYMCIISVCSKHRKSMCSGVETHKCQRHTAPRESPHQCDSYCTSNFFYLTIIKLIHTHTDVQWKRSSRRRDSSQATGFYASFCLPVSAFVLMLL